MRTIPLRLGRAAGYRFQNRDLLATALTHRSYANEHPALGRSDNEMLEFLGDAVLDLVIGHMLMERYPEAREGELSVTRSQVVSEVGLAEVADELRLGEFLFLGKGEQRSGGRDKPSLLSDAVEARSPRSTWTAGSTRPGARPAVPDPPGQRRAHRLLRPQGAARSAPRSGCAEPRSTGHRGARPGHERSSVAVRLRGKALARQGRKSNRATPPPPPSLPARGHGHLSAGTRPTGAGSGNRKLGEFWLPASNFPLPASCFWGSQL
jgi:hypothetical protein